MLQSKVSMFVLSMLAASSIVSLGLTAKSATELRRYRYHASPTAPEDLPTVSVCIAARNETHALAKRLDNILASTYQKLEILVLDDNSEDDTSLIIKSYAHAGVRFIPGKDLPEGWLGKNHAYQILAEQSSSQLVLFLDVDTSLAPNTISDLVNYMYHHGTSMVSVLPMRLDGYRNSAVFGTLRYFWELIYSHPSAPPAASAAWLIHRRTLLELESGLPDYKSSVRPEAHIAKQFVRGNQYSYIIGTSELGLGYEKRIGSQYETATRLYYPISGRNPLAAITAVVLLGLMVFPVGVLITRSELGIYALIALLIGAVSIGQFSIRTHSHASFLRRMILWPFIISQEFLLYVHSLARYGTGSVTWKGRSVMSRPTNRSHLRIDE